MSATMALEPVMVGRESGLVTLVLNVPEQRNALNLRLAEALSVAVDQAVEDPSVRVVVLTAAGPTFGVGGDLNALVDVRQAPAAADHLLGILHRVISRIWTSPQIFVAGARGGVAGGSLALALACDLVYWGEDSRLVPAYAALGASPDCGLSISLTRILGPRRALEWLLDGSVLQVTEARAMGLLRHVVPDGEVEQCALAAGRKLAALPAAALAHSKSLVETALQLPITEQLDRERKAFVACAASAGFAERVARRLAGAP